MEILTGFMIGMGATSIALFCFHTKNKDTHMMAFDGGLIATSAFGLACIAML